LARGLPSTYFTLSCKKIRVTPEIRTLPSGTLLKLLELENVVKAAGHHEVSINQHQRWPTPYAPRILAGAANKAASNSVSRFTLSLPVYYITPTLPH